MTSVEREQTNKHTNTHIHTHIHKHTYRVKTEETFFYGQIFYFLFFLLYLFESIKRRFPTTFEYLVQPTKSNVQFDYLCFTFQVANIYFKENFLENGNFGNSQKDSSTLKMSTYS